MKRILITGACGYLGAKLSKYLAESGNEITAFCNSNPIGDDKWITIMDEVIIGDIRDESVISKLAKKKFDVVIHLISLDHRNSEDNPNYVYQINVMPTWNLLNIFSRKGIDKFIYFSTQKVHGEPCAIKIDEYCIPNPNNVYGLTHLLSENIVNYYNTFSETKCINIRLSNSYGSPVFKDNNCWWLVLNDFCKTAFIENNIKLNSDGSSHRDFIHIIDICTAIEILIKEDSSFDSNIINIASGKTLTILELAHVVKSVFNERFSKDIPIEFSDNTISNTADVFENDERYVIDTSRINKFGFKLKTSLKSGIIELFNYIENNYG